MNRVHPFSEAEIRALERLHRETDDADVRSRCDMIPWSNECLLSRRWNDGRPGKAAGARGVLSGARR